MRRAFRSLLPTIAVLLASLQAARAGASGLETGALSTPAHHRDLSGPERLTLALPRLATVRPAALTTGAARQARGYDANPTTLHIRVIRSICSAAAQPRADRFDLRSPSGPPMVAPSRQSSHWLYVTAPAASAFVPRPGLAGISSRTPDRVQRVPHLAGAARPRAPCRVAKGRP